MPPRPSASTRPARLLRSFALLLVMVLVAAACGGGDSDTASGGESTSSTAGLSGAPGANEGSGPATTNAADTVPDEELDRDAVLRIFYTVAPTSIDPHKGSSSTDATSVFLFYDRLVHLSPQAEPIAGLATDWELDPSVPELRMTLREGVVFHDGTPFNAEAAKVNLDRARLDPESNVATELEAVTDVVVTGDYTISLKLDSPTAAIVGILGDRAGAMISPAAIDNPDLDRRPVGAGMFRVTDYAEGSRIVMERFEDYWDPDAVKVAGVDLTFQSDDTTRLNAVRDGQADWANIAARQIPEAESAGLQVTSGLDLGFYHVQFNLARSEFGNPLVRKALNHAIDRQGMVDAVFRGRATPNVQPFPPGYFAFNDEVTDLYPYDPELAKQLLAEAGVPDGFSFELLTANLDAFVQVSEIVKAQLEQIGVEVTLNVVPVNEVVQRAYTDKVGDAVMITFQGRPDPSQTLGRLYSSTGFNNMGGVSTARIDELYEQSLREGDPAARTQLLQDLTGEVTREAMDLVLLSAEAHYVMPERVVGFQPYLSAKPEFRGVGIRAE